MKNILKKIYSLAAVVSVALIPALAFADEPPNDVLTRFINNVTNAIIQPIILLLFALAMYYFIKGITTFITKSDDPKARETGRSHMIWAVIGFFIMVSVVTILQIAANTIYGTGAVDVPGAN